MYVSWSNDEGSGALDMIVSLCVGVAEAHEGTVSGARQW